MGNMRSRKDKSTALFHEIAADYSKFRPFETPCMACPLCLAEFSLADIADLSREHVIPSSLGGKMETLTCKRRCNNTHGSRLDSHLINAMRAMDAVDGLEPIAMTLGSDKGKIVGELLLGDGTKEKPNTIRIVGKASKRDATEQWRGQLGDGFSFDLRMTFPCIPERFFRAVFRAGFLAVFKAEGYGYALSDGASQVRSMIESRAPVLEKVVMEAFPERDPGRDAIVMPMAFNDVGEYYMVLLRFRTKRVRYVVAILPGKSGSNWSALEGLYQHAPRLRIETTPHDWEQKLYIHLGYDPIVRIRERLRAHFMPDSAASLEA